MLSRAACFPEIKSHVDSLPVVDCHDHAAERSRVTDIIAYVVRGYFSSDICAASSDADARFMTDASLPLEKRWPVFEKAWTRTLYTGYGLAARRAMQKVLGVSELTLDTASALQEKLPDFSDPAVYDPFYEEARIVARIANLWPAHKKILDGSWQLLPGQRIVIGLPAFHNFRNRADIQGFEESMDRTVTSLDDFLRLCRDIFSAYKAYGAVAFKDQSAYQRTLAYRNPPRSDAEAVFNRILADPRYSAEFDPDGSPLSDFLMHEFMRMARDMDLPVQIHTGHMAGIRNDVAKTNAAGLRSLLEIHRDVRFDLFHANWPYSGDLLFLVKNYPNVCADFCWANIIDPVYCRNMLVQAVSSVPHGKIHGFGSDVGGNQPDVAWAHCVIAKENISCALADLVDMDYISVDDAKRIASDWLFNNPNAFFRLGLKA
ncbi:MAG: amidohydrolase family protein [Planctomycetes bacterium]|nr:amidohydrolase family protein [Planctomycetota bacterium]